MAVGITQSSLTISSPGGSASDTINVSSVLGFSGAVTLACQVTYQGSGTVSEPPTCALNPQQANVAASSPMTSTLTVSTTAASASAIRNDSWVASGEVIAALLIWVFLPGRRGKLPWLLALLVVALASHAIGCGGGSSKTQSNPGTTIGNYQVVVTATSSAAASSAKIALTLQ